MTIFDLDELSADDLEHLAQVKRDEERCYEDARIAGLLRGESAWAGEDRRLTEQSDPLTNVVFSALIGSKPEPCSTSRARTISSEPAALGFYRQTLARRPYGGWPAIPVCKPGRRSDPTELIVTAINMAADGVASDAAEDVLADLAAAHGLSGNDLADAVLAYRGEA